MPVEIRELVIRATVEDHGTPATASSSSTSPANTDAIIAACVEQVMEILKQKTER